MRNPNFSFLDEGKRKKIYPKLKTFAKSRKSDFSFLDGGKRKNKILQKKILCKILGTKGDFSFLDGGKRIQ